MLNGEWGMGEINGESGVGSDWSLKRPVRWGLQFVGAGARADRAMLAEGWAALTHRRRFGIPPARGRTGPCCFSKRPGRMSHGRLVDTP